MTREAPESHSLLMRLIDWLTESFERAQMHDRDRYVALARNPREVSQRLHQLERGEDSFHA
jgi:hypothetical protein